VDLRQLLSEARKREVASPAALCEKIEQGLFDRQRSFLRDKAKFRALRCGRRSGKTSLGARELIAAAIKHKGATIPCIETSRQAKAAEAMWRMLQEVGERYSLDLKVNQQSMALTLPNASVISISGAGNKVECDKFRGDKYPLVFVDEAASFRPSVLRYLIDECVEPALTDYDGQLVLAGTPGAALAGPFYEITGPNRQKGWSVHEWTMHENPHIPHAARWLADLRERRGWDERHPVYVREYLGKHVYDPTGLVYRYDPQKNDIDALPASKSWRYVLGVDLGYVDSTAFVVGAYSPDFPELYVVESSKETELLPDDVAKRILHFQDKYSLERIVADTGGLGKPYVEVARRRYGIAVEAAEKKDKRAAQEALSGDFAASRVKIVEGENDCLVDELKILQWDEQRLKEDDRFENHACDALVYMSREVYHYLHKDPEPVKTRQELAIEHREKSFQRRVRSTFRQKRSQVWET
jgi:hypothetical protein